MKVLVTGGAGFIGSHLVENLVENNTVLVIDNLDEGNKEYIDDKAEFKEVDIRDQEKIDNIVKQFSPDIIYHLAAYNDAMGSLDDTEEAINTNIQGTVNLLEASIDNDVDKIVYASSGGLSYGEPEEVPTSESANLEPVYPYGVSKTSATMFIKDYSRRKNLEYAVCRLGSVYGPRANGGVIKNFFEKIEQNERPIIYGNGTQTRDFVHVKDVVTGIRKAAKDGNGVYNLGTGTQISVSKLLEEIADLTNKEIKPIHKERWEGDIDLCELSIEKAEDDLGWKPEISLEKGLKLCREYYL